jgi:hypothetical protein
MGILHIVHCIDTEGPLTETLSATFQRLKEVFGVDLPPTRENLRKLQNCEIDLGGIENSVSRMIAPELLNYNNSWIEIRKMLDEALSKRFRRQMVDDFGNGWIYSWHCMDHMYYFDNPRHKDVGYGNIFRSYREILYESHSDQDELNWHFHPISITGNPLQAATSYSNSYPVLLEILCRRIIEDSWFPVVNRPGFHAERPDSHLFLEQWVPFDYANQFHEDDIDQPDLAHGRFGDWRRAPNSWRGYRPCHDDYQTPGNCKRIIFRCLNVGTRLRPLKFEHIFQALQEARQKGKAILAFADHDYRDIRLDVNTVRSMLKEVHSNFPDVKLKFSGAEAAARDLLEVAGNKKPKLSLSLGEKTLIVRLDEGEIFGPQPFLAIKSKDGRFFHDNLDIKLPGQIWTYVFDDQTLPISAISKVGVGTAGRFGGYCVACVDVCQ